MGWNWILALSGLLVPLILGIEVEVGVDGLGNDISNDINHLENYHHSDTSTVNLNTRVDPSQHPYTRLIPGFATSACAAKFRSLSSRKIDMWWDDGSDGVFSGTLRPSEVVSASSYVGHTFFFTVHKNKTQEISRVIIAADTAYYNIFDPDSPGNEDDIKLAQAEEAFSEEYFTRTGLKWRHFYGKDGPRPPPTLYMWPAETIGQVHSVTTSHGYWNCEGPESICQDEEDVELQIQVIATTPKLFIVENFMSSFEADSMISQAQSNAPIDDSASVKGGGPNATRYWVKRSANDVMDTIAQRAADVLGMDESILVSTSNTEDFQVLHYTVGQKYDNHHDWGQAGVKGYSESRYVSMLLYLSSQDDQNTGGETSFPKAIKNHSIHIKPMKGTAVFFYNLLPDGNGDDLAVHAAEPVLTGDKWIANFWVWDPKRFSSCGMGDSAPGVPNGRL